MAISPIRRLHVVGLLLGGIDRRAMDEQWMCGVARFQ
jgi:hypothetical protein